MKKKYREKYNPKIWGLSPNEELIKSGIEIVLESQVKFSKKDSNRIARDNLELKGYTKLQISSLFAFANNKNKKPKKVKKSKKVDYKKYINSKAWTKTRQKYFNKHGKDCKKCGSEEDLHVHHKNYKNIGEENIDKDLVSLCQSCHNKFHKIVHSYDKELSIKTDLFIM